MTAFLIIFVIVLIVILVAATGDQNKKKDAVKYQGKIEEPKPERATIEYDDSISNIPYYMFYSIVATHFGDFKNVTKDNASAYPEMYQIAYTLFDREEKLIQAEEINIEFNEIPAYEKRKILESESELREEAIPKLAALKKFADICKGSHVFITHAAFHHRDILFANYYKEELPLPFKKSQSVDVMEETKKWVDIEKDSGRGLKSPSFTECVSMAMTGNPYRVKKTFKAAEKVVALPKIYFTWKDNQ